MKLRLASIVAAAAILAGAYPFVQLHIAAQGGGASQVGPDTELDGTLEMVYEDGWDAPRLKHFLDFWARNLEGRLYRVTVAHRRLLRPAEVKLIAGDYRMH